MPKNYEEFKKTIAEMGLEDFSGMNPPIGINPIQNTPMILGDYRNHHIKIYEVTFNHGGSDEPTISYTTYYEVAFENPQNIMMTIKKRSIFSRSIFSLLHKRL